MKFLSIDVETTGLDPDKDLLLESGIKMDGEIHSALSDAVITGKMILAGLRRVLPCA